jgi:hypothetical protein
MNDGTESAVRRDAQLKRRVQEVGGGVADKPEADPLAVGPSPALRDFRGCSYALLLEQEVRSWYAHEQGFAGRIRRHPSM